MIPIFLQFPDPLWRTLLDVVVALSTIGITLFAAVELYREHRRDEERERNAHARLSAAAFLTRNRLLGWISSHGLLDNLTVWDRSREDPWITQLNVVSNEFRDMMNMIADAPKTPAKGLRTAFVYYQEGQQRVLQYLAIKSHPSFTEMAETKWFAGALKDFWGCVNALEQHVIDPDLLRLEREQRVLRVNEGLAAIKNPTPTDNTSALPLPSESASPQTASGERSALDHP